jgi:hypothetical protein
LDGQECDWDTAIASQDLPLPQFGDRPACKPRAPLIDVARRGLQEKFMPGLNDFQVLRQQFLDDVTVSAA